MFISQSNKQAFRNPWVLGWIGLLFVVVLLDAIFIITAFNTSPGLVDKDYYEKGRDVEKNFLKKQQARNRLGWETNLNLPEKIIAGQVTRFDLSISDSAGIPLPGATVHLQAYRPSDASADYNTDMEKVSDGVFRSSATLPYKGIWDIKILVQKGADKLELSRRINVLAP
ncbi:FixH family protein [Sedimenticola sp.]|uniref:FixH family protein n=1 Tax=Sedimenticola sp. TaxID=1940285 RepID=UPI003D137A24